MAELGGTLWGIGLLLLPVILAVPVRWLFHSWLGNKAKHTRYREAVRRVLNSGSTLSKFRMALDEEARHLHISEDRQSRIETAMLTPLSIVHFIFIPGVTLSPLISLIAAPVYLLAWPLLRLCERILIHFGFLLLGFRIGLIRPGVFTQLCAACIDIQTECLPIRVFRALH